MILLLTVISIAVVVITIVFDMIYQNTSIPDFVAPEVTQPNEIIFNLDLLVIKKIFKTCKQTSNSKRANELVK